MGEFVCNLKKYRQLAGFSQDELAALVMVRRETISRLEAGKYNPSLKLRRRHIPLCRRSHRGVVRVPGRGVTQGRKRVERERRSSCGPSSRS